MAEINTLDQSESGSCLICKGKQLRSRGIIFHPDPARVAGTVIDLEGKQYHLLRCLECGFQFKSPMLDEGKLLACYAAATNDHWGFEVDPIKRNFDRMRAAIDRHATGKRVLDIGCFNGAFLDYLGASWDRYGVEPCIGARLVAQQRGVDVLGDTINEISVETKFDVITAFDVIEHIVEPFPFFRSIQQRLNPGGIFVASSGDTDTLGWRLQGARYWYCSYLPEHVSFFSKQTLDFIGDKLQMKTVNHEHMSHKRAPLNERVTQGFNGYSYSILLHTGWLGLSVFRNKFSARAGTAWGAATDHFLHVFQLEKN